MLPNWLYGKSKSKLASILGGGGGTPADYNQVKAQVAQNKLDIAQLTEDIISLDDQLDDKAALTQITNRNLLDNPWFTVNQRGQSSYASTGYTVDRWAIGYGDIICNVTDNGITLSSSILDSTYVQYIEEAFYNKFIAGKDVTLSVLLTNGTIKSVTGHAPVNTSDYQNIGVAYITDTCTLTLVGKTGENEQVQIRFTEANSDAISIRAVKLELGSVSTLAMDVAPNYTTELIKCKHYFQVFTGDLGRAMTVLANRMQFNVPLPVRLYSNPAVTATPRIFNLDTTEETGFTFSYSAINNLQTLRINADKSAHGLTDGYVNAGTAKMYISAEL